MTFRNANTHTRKKKKKKQVWFSCDFKLEGTLKLGSREDNSSFSTQGF